MKQPDPHDRPTVLVVDDEPLIRMVVADAVDEAGFATVEAANASEAVELLETHQEICTLLTDINMPGSMDGLALARYVHDRWPLVSIFVTTGRVRLRNEDLPPGSRFLSKPYSPTRLVELLHGLGPDPARCAG